MNLKDQLLKAGLISKKQAQKAESSQKKQEHDAKKNKQLANKLNEEKQFEIQQIEEAAHKRKELDKELNKKRDLMLQQRESFYRARQLIYSNALNHKTAEELYFFSEGKYVRKVFINAWQREMLARGKIGIARVDKENGEFILIPLSVAKIIHEIYPENLIILHTEVADNEEYF